MAQIAEMFETYPNKIRRILQKHGVKILNKSEAQKNALSHRGQALKMLLQELQHKGGL